MKIGFRSEGSTDLSLRSHNAAGLTGDPEPAEAGMLSASPLGGQSLVVAWNGALAQESLTKGLKVREGGATGLERGAAGAQALPFPGGVT